jgi:hypothetical protein
MERTSGARAPRYPIAAPATRPHELGPRPALPDGDASDERIVEEDAPARSGARAG